MTGEIIMVWNAKSGKINLYLDILHKVISPKTYPCHLCDITHDLFSAKVEWKKFLKEFPLPIYFLHKDEWESQYELKYDWPAILVKNEGSINVMLQRKEIEKMTLEKLIGFLWQEFQLSR